MASVIPSLPPHLPNLSPNEAIIDALYRAVLGLDTNNSELFNSAFFEDASFSVNGETLQGRASLNDGMFARIAPLNTTHFITNVRVNAHDGGSKASLTASSLAQHFRPGEGYQGEQNRLTGALYYLELEKDEGDGLWKSKNFKMQTAWAQGERLIVRGS